MIRYKIGSPIYLFCSLAQGESNRFIKAFVYKADGTLAVGGDGSVEMVHVSNGLYKTSLPITLQEGTYVANFKPFLDAGYTVEDDIYGVKDDAIEIYSDAALDISVIESKIDALSSAVLSADYEVFVEEIPELEVVLSEDDSDIDLVLEADNAGIDIEVEDDGEIDVIVDEDPNIIELYVEE